MRSDGACNYYDEEEGCDDAGDAVKNDHGHRRRRRRPSWRRVVRAVLTIATHIAGTVVQGALLSKGPLVGTACGREIGGSSGKFLVVAGIRRRIDGVVVGHTSASL